MFKERREIEGIIEKYKQELANLGIRVERVILYGSYASDKPREDSDIDLIVISADFKKMNLRERLEVLGLAAGKVLEPIEALGYTREEALAKTRESFVGEVLTSLAITL